MSQISCFVVNLATASQRRGAMETLLEQHHIKPTWFDAVDGRMMSESVLAGHFNSTKAEIAYGPMVRAEIGTTLSHLGIYRQMVENDIACAVILEDDILLAEDFGALLQTDGSQSLSALFKPDQAVMLQMTHVMRAYRHGAIKLGAREVVRPHGGVWLTSGYFITLAAAKNLLRAMYPVWMVADHWRLFEREGLLTIHALTPNAVWESDLSLVSDIAPERRARRRDKKTPLDRLKRVWDRTIVRPFLVRDLSRFPLDLCVDSTHHYAQQHTKKQTSF